MPEGDTVYLAAQRLHGALADRVLTTSDFRVPHLATTELTGRRVFEVVSRGKHLLTRETHLDYFSGLTLSEMGRKVEANRCWNRAVADSHPITWLTFYAAMSLEALGRKTEADKLFEEIRTFAEHQIQADVKIDYFATSLPNLLLFEDNLQKRNHVDCLFLLALSELGMRNTERAVELLNEVLTLDCNHIAAQLELQHLKRMPAVAGTRQ